jgi:hypothetical protein
MSKEVLKIFLDNYAQKGNKILSCLAWKKFNWQLVWEELLN